MRHRPAMRARMLGFFFRRGTDFGPGDDTLHLRADVVLHAFGVANVRVVDGDGGEDLEDAVNEEPAAATGFEGVQVVDEVVLLEFDEVLHEVHAHVVVAEDVDVAGFRVGEGLAAGLGNVFGCCGGFFEGEGCFGFGCYRHGIWCPGEGVWYVREVMAVVEGDDDVCERELRGVDSHGLTSFANDGPFLALSVF